MIHAPTATEAHVSTRLLKSGLAEFNSVRLLKSVSLGAVTYPAGTPGVIVHRHSDGVGYEVEVEKPGFAVLTLTMQDIAVT